MAEFIPLVDFPDHFYYDSLASGLTDLRFSKDGIHQIMSELPVTLAEDRRLVRGTLIRVVADAQKPADVISVVWEFVKGQLKKLGPSEKAVLEVERLDPLTGANDRATLTRILKVWLVRNESRVPRGYPQHLKQLWKRKQLESHNRS